MSNAQTRIKINIDLNLTGHQFGELMLPWSDNSIPLGYHPTPLISI